MKAGKALDSDIANKILKMKITDPSDIPKYSTNIYSAYEVISKMQNQGWSFHVKSKITPTGGLIYRSRFVRGNQHTEQHSPSLPMSICIAALAIVNDQYFEYVDEEEDERPIEIVGTADSKPVLKNIDISTESLEELLARRLSEFELPSTNDLKFKDILTENDLRKLPKAFLKFFVDILNENNYCISKRIDD